MPHLKINRKLEPFLTKAKPLKIGIGGRGSGKSIGFGDIFTMKMETEQCDIYCLREFQESIEDSVHRVMVASVQERLKLEGWGIYENKVVSPWGNRTRYKGAARNPDSIQSAQGFKYSWYEEAHTASKESLDKLLPTILRNPGAECWFSANPQYRNDPFSQRFIVPYMKELKRDGYYEDDMHLIVVMNWRDNPWWNDEQESLRQWDYENRPRSEYDWIWEGAFRDGVENAIIKPEWFDAAIDAHEKIGFRPTGIRAVSHDPSDTGPDAKGLTYRHGSVILDVLEKHDGDVNEGADWAVEYADRVRADDFVWDVGGMGVSLKRQIEGAIPSIRCTPFNGAESPVHPEEEYQPSGKQQERRTNKQTFRNKRSQFAWYLRDRFYNTYLAVNKRGTFDEDSLISISSSIDCIDQLRSETTSIPLKPSTNGMIQICSKEELAKPPYSMKSPNLFDSLFMSFANPRTDDLEDFEIEFKRKWA